MLVHVGLAVSSDNDFDGRESGAPISEDCDWRALAEKNASVAREIARKFRPFYPGIDPGDLESEAYLCLCRLAQSYRAATGVPFPAYLRKYLPHQLRAALVQTARAFKLPVKVAERIALLKSVSRTVYQQTGRRLSAEALAQAYNAEFLEKGERPLCAREIQHLFQADEAAISLETLQASQGGVESFLPQTSVMNAAMQADLAWREDDELMLQLLQETPLSSLQRRVMRLLFQGQRPSEVARQLNIKKSCVSRAKRIAQTKLQAAAQAKGMGV